MENILFLEAYMSILKEVDVIVRTDLIQYLIEPLPSWIQDLQIQRAIVQELYNNLLSPSATAQLNVDASVVNSIQALLATNTEFIELGQLEVLKAQVIRLVYENTFRGFVAECRLKPSRHRAFSISSSRSKRDRSRTSRANSILHSSAISEASSPTQELL
jgi:hypothetical protein